MAQSQGLAHPVWIMARVPGASPEETVEWTDVCHSREPFVSIHYERSYLASRWVSRERKHPYAVWWSNGRASLATKWSYHKTLDAARKAAAKLAKERAQP